jgi:hypothetical protein
MPLVAATVRIGSGDVAFVPRLLSDLDLNMFAAAGCTGHAVPTPGADDTRIPS